MELGSTAKLRTLAHYLELGASLYEDREVRELRPVCLKMPSRCGLLRR